MAERTGRYMLPAEWEFEALKRRASVLLQESLLSYVVITSS